jgi:hypothetical protein
MTAEVASNRPVRQKFLWLGAGGTLPDAWSVGISSVRNGVNLRKGTVTWEKVSENALWRNLSFETASMEMKGEIGPQKIQESVFKKFENAFFYEILYFRLEVFSRLLLI